MTNPTWSDIATNEGASSTLNFVDRWLDLTPRIFSPNNFMHSGVVFLDESTLVCADPSGKFLQILSADGVNKTLETGLIEAHGISNGLEPSQVLIADPGYRNDVIDDDHNYSEILVPGRAVLFDTTEGAVVREFKVPEHEAYLNESWHPTSVAAGLEDGLAVVWVSDGYGQNLIHKYSATGNHMLTFDGTVTGLKLDCPHAVATRQTTPGNSDLYVADRANHRILVFNSHGMFLREFGQAHLDSPSGLAWVGTHLFVTELAGGIAVFEDENFLGSLESVRARDRNEPGWPNKPGANDHQFFGPTLQANVFNSPHGLAACGNLVALTEWLVGGRLLVLAIAD